MNFWKRKLAQRQSAIAVSILGVLLLTAAPAQAQQNQPRCMCEFADSKWRAYGTKAACAVYMHDGRTACEVEFAGVSANPNLISMATGQRARYINFDSMGSYFQLLAKGDRSTLSDPKIFVPIIEALMRGAYFREPLKDRAVAMDKAVVSFFERYATDVSDVFLAKASPFQREWSGAKFEVGRGFVTVDLAGDRITAVYFSAE